MRHTCRFTQKVGPPSRKSEMARAAFRHDCRTMPRGLATGSILRLYECSFDDRNPARTFFSPNEASDWNRSSGG